MTHTACFVVAIALSSALIAAQEEKKVPKDSVRVSIPGCTKGYVFTAGRRTSDEPGYAEIREGMHLRMNGPKDMMKEIKVHEGSMIEIVGLMKKGQMREGISIGGARVTAGSGQAGGVGSNPTAGQILIDVEGWRSVPGSCPSS